ncbi:rex protein [Simian T-cell lymphotropic virus 6]|uniref:Rex protein n=4 Tax=Primate T-lymphotropic virus 3 TaxID=194443 RepID=D1MNA2_9DELA|nr:rex protein [Simian T-cell lymphotropic virus 6]ABW89485.1 rex protein [Simian T-cell lymphotropic virus 6]ADE43694.1 rex protein [Human T-lymphotropic virus 3]
MPKTRRQRNHRIKTQRPSTPWPTFQVSGRACSTGTLSTFSAIVCRPIGAPFPGGFVPPGYIGTPYWPPVLNTRSPGTPSMDALSARLYNTLSLASPPSPPKELPAPSRSSPRRPLLQPPKFLPPSSMQSGNTPLSETTASSSPWESNYPPCLSPTPASDPKMSIPCGEAPSCAYTSTNSHLQ